LRINNVWLVRKKEIMTLADFSYWLAFLYWLSLKCVLFVCEYIGLAQIIGQGGWGNIWHSTCDLLKVQMKSHLCLEYDCVEVGCIDDNREMECTYYKIIKFSSIRSFDSTCSAMMTKCVVTSDYIQIQ